jgi:hypothetical protein
MEWSAEVESRWQALADEVLTGMKEWRLQHPGASLREIDAALDERLSRVRRWSIGSPRSPRSGRGLAERRGASG